MRNYRKIPEKFEIRMTTMQILLSITAALIFCLLIFVMGFISGKRYTEMTAETHSVRVKVPPEGAETAEIKKDVIEKPDSERKQEEPSKSPELTFYEKLEKQKSPPVDFEEKDDYRYTLQAGAFKDKKQAAAVRNKLKSKGYDASIETAKVKGKEIWHRVRFGRFSSKAEALKEAKKLEKELRIKAIVVPIGE